MDKIEVELKEAMRFGSVSSADWQSYTWKYELAAQKERISERLREIFDDVETEHNPYHMIERVVGIAAVCMRRLIEWWLVTDLFRDSNIEVYRIHCKAEGEWRERSTD